MTGDMLHCFLFGTLGVALVCTLVQGAPDVLLIKVNNNKHSCVFTSVIYLEVRGNNLFPQSVELYRKNVIDTDPPIYVIQARENGTLYFVQKSVPSKASAAYQNTGMGAAFIARCKEGVLHIEGTIYLKGRKYRLKPKTDANLITDTLTAYKEYEYSIVEDIQEIDEHLRAMNMRRKGRNSHWLPKPESRGPSARVKRDAKDYDIDILVVLDYSFYKYWYDRNKNNETAALAAAKDYIIYIFNGVNSRFSTISSAAYNLNINVCGFYIAENTTISVWTESVKQTAGGNTVVDANQALTALETWAADNYAALPVHDHLMLFTEYDLYGNDNGFRFNNTAGFANVGVMCKKDGTSASVVEDHGGYQSEGTVTHELGHSLGAEHDGQNNGCDAADRYIMSTGQQAQTAATETNPWHFSSCSVKYFESYLNGLNASLKDSCLKRASSAEVPTVAGLPGELSGPDEQCRQIYGDDSYLCRGTNFGAPDAVCSSMYCKNPQAAVSSCTQNTAAPGTCCGNGKWCLQGACVDANKATCYMNTSCPFGQRQGIVANGKTCDELDSGNCYDTEFRQVCCEMCDKKYQAKLGCEYGDKVTNCDASFCGRTLAEGQLYDIKCCRTCSYVLTTLTPPTPTSTTTPTLASQIPDVVEVCRDVDLVENNLQSTCVNLINSTYGPAYCCQENTERNVCCQTCKSIKRLDDPTCPYGDCARCIGVASQNVLCNAEQEENCCQSCREVRQRLSPESSTASNTQKTTNTATSGNEDLGVPCVPVLGVRTCGSLALHITNWNTLALGIVLTLIIHSLQFRC